VYSGDDGLVSSIESSKRKKKLTQQKLFIELATKNKERREAYQF
jgi:hypothetical protein